MAPVEAARITYGMPTKGLDSVLKVKKWLDAHCREWHYESGAVQGVGCWAPITVSAVFKVPIDKAKLANLVTHQVKRWGFERPRRATKKFVVDSVVAGIEKRSEQRLQKERAQHRRAAFAKVLAEVKQRAVDRKLTLALSKLRKNVEEAQGLMDAALEENRKRRLLVEAS